MLKYLEKHRTLIAIILLSILLATFLFAPAFKQLASMVMLVSSITMAVVLVSQKHWKTYQNAECTREKMIRNQVFDLLGLLLTMGAAILVGRFAGEYFGIRMGIWVGLLAGFAGGFLAAWGVRTVWGKLVRLT